MDVLVVYLGSLLNVTQWPRKTPRGAKVEKPQNDSPDLPEGPNPLVGRIFAALPELSKKHKDIARFVLDNPDSVAFASAGEVGAKTGTSAATVVRFCQSLGFEGYIQLQRAMRERMSLQRRAMQRLEQQMAERIAEEELLTRVLATDIHNIERTAIQASRDRFQAAAEDMRRARQVLIVGIGLAAVLVEYLVYSLQRVDVPTRSVTGGEEPLAMALAFVKPEDVVIGISFRRSPRYTLKALEQAKIVGARSIGIADSELSPLFQVADYSFRIVMDNLVNSPSPVAAVSLLNALVVILSLSAPERTAYSLQKIDETYKQSGLLEE
jgi:DNA-binding MurR/RpiR family transcriptional regulator